MASTNALALVALDLQQRWWVQWAILYAIPLGFFFLGRVVALSSILDMTASPSERSAGNKAAGVFLGILEDLLATTLLVAALGLVECIGVVSSRLVQPRIRDRLATSIVVRYLGQFARFLAALTLAIVWLAIVAADLLLVCTQHIRLTKTHDRSTSDALARARHDVFFSAEAIVGVGGVSLLLAGLFTWLMNLAHWLEPSATSPGRHESLERTRLSTRSSPRASSTKNATPTYLQASFMVFPSTPPELPLHSPRNSSDSVTDRFREGRHVTIVSATGDVDEYHPSVPEDEPFPGSLRLTQPVVSKRPRSLTHRHRTIAVAVAALAVFVLVESVVLALAKSAGPVVANIALNGTLNEIMRTFFGFEFLSKVVTR